MKFLVVACTHGNEKYGLETVRNLSLSVDFLIGNPEAVKKNVRFVDSDLNRIFPGKENGNIEEKRAFELIGKLKEYDFVIDLHSCSQACEVFGIITKPSLEKIEFAKQIGLKKLVIMFEGFASGKSLIDFCKCGISLEVGSHERRENAGESVHLINNFLDGENKNEEIEIFEIFELIKRKGEISFLENFREIKKGDLIMIGSNGERQLAETDFFPILANESEYKEVLCLAGRKVNLKDIKF